MKLILIFAFVFVFGSVVFGETAAFNIIPRPASIKVGGGHFKFDQKTKIVAQDEVGRKMAGLLNDLLMANYGFKLEYTDKDISKNAIRFSTTAIRTTDPRQGEAYSMLISKDQLEILATENGMFYAIQTLMQILPVKYSGAVEIPVAEINDVPRFQYRGMHLDVSRHFMPVSFVKKFIDLMSQYKLNTFHWHLTDDQGWRIEIKKYPKLTEIGSTAARNASREIFAGFQRRRHSARRILHAGRNKRRCRICEETFYNCNSRDRIAGTRIGCSGGLSRIWLQN